MVCVLIQSLKLQPKHCSLFDVKVESSQGRTALIEPREDLTVLMDCFLFRRLCLYVGD